MKLKPTIDVNGTDRNGDGDRISLVAFALEDVLEFLELRPSELVRMDSLDLAEALGFDTTGYLNGPGEYFSRGARADVRGQRVVVRETHAIDM